MACSSFSIVALEIKVGSARFFWARITDEKTRSLKFEIHSLTPFQIFKFKKVVSLGGVHFPCGTGG